jgi:hypothetical protein
MLDLPQYLFAVGALALAICPLACGAARVRARLLAGWSGLPARLADAVLVLALLIGIAEALGAVGMLSRLPLIAACLAVGLGLRAAIGPATASAAVPPAPDPGGWGRGVALAVAAVVGVHWMIGTVDALGVGITNYDSTWYHMPFAAHFAQTGSTFGFDYVSPRYLAWFYPQNSELLHGVGIVLTDRDVLSPLLNLLWLAGCLAAAWCVGRPYGKGAWTLTAAALLLDAGVMADQAGQARNDTLGIFFLLAALALLVNAAATDRLSRIPAGPLAVAGLAVGLAAGTKLSFIAPAAALLVGVPALAVSGRRLRALLAFGAALLAGCGFWYARNVAVADNPLPWFKALGPLRLDGPEQGLGGKHQHSVLHYLGDGHVWSRWFEPNLSARFGELWLLVGVLAIAAIAVAALRGSGVVRLASAAVAAGVVAYLLDGTSAEGPAGIPEGFASSLRHLLPALFLALVVAPLVLDPRSRRGRIAAASTLAVLLLAADRSGQSWRPAYLVLAAALAGAAFWLCSGRGAWPRSNWGAPARRVAAVGAAIALFVGGGWFLQRAYLSHRYDGRDFRSAGLNAAFRWAGNQQQQKIATTVPIQYPLMGEDLSNEVSFVGRRGHDAGFTPIRSCRPWRAALAAGGYRYVLTSGGMASTDAGTSRCLADDPRARPVVREDRIVVFRLLQRRPDAESRGIADPTSGGVRPLKRAQRESRS